MTAKREKNEKDVIDLMLDPLDFHGMTKDELTGKDGLLRQLTSRFYERILNAEMDEYLGYKKHDNAGDHCGNSRNGYSEKTVILDDRGTRSMVSGYGRSKILGRCVDRNKKPRYRRYTDSLYGRTYRIS